MDFEGAEEELRRYGAGEEPDVEEYFHREWDEARLILGIDPGGTA